MTASLTTLGGGESILLISINAGQRVLFSTSSGAGCSDEMVDALLVKDMEAVDPLIFLPWTLPVSPTKRSNGYGVVIYSTFYFVGLLVLFILQICCRL